MNLNNDIISLTRVPRSTLTYVTGFLMALIAAQAVTSENHLDDSNNTRAYFGELHVHTMNSPDAYMLSVRTTPENAIRFAMGEPVEHSISGARMQLSQPLDFIAVTDHSEYMGVLPGLFQGLGALGKSDISNTLRNSNEETRQHTLMDILMTLATGVPKQALVDQAVQASIWQHYVEISNQYNDPDNFTTFIGYEWTSSGGLDGVNLHRNIIFKSDRVPAIPFSSFDSIDPRKLWDWMDKQRSNGMELLAIPHNSNLSDGLMFPDKTAFDGRPIDADYSAQRNRNEPLIEITQIKGSSETHPSLSPNDEWADFEILDDLLGGTGQLGKTKGSYAREAWVNGLLMQENQGFNPYQFAVIAASDSHNSSTQIEENNYFGKIGSADGTPETRRGGSFINKQHIKYSASGLAGVWADSNNRASIYDALERGETFGTTGPRIQVRFFGVWEWPTDGMLDPNWIAKAYNEGVPMGQQLPKPENAESSPNFLISAIKDPSSAWLQRLQIIKGWVRDGKKYETVYDVACSDGLTPDPATHRCPDNGATVSLSTCDYDKTKGDSQLSVQWQDPNFDSGQNVIYYARVLENPTCRWSTWDSLRTGLPISTDVPPTIQERAYSSPIWYNPRTHE